MLVQREERIIRAIARVIEGAIFCGKVDSSGHVGALPSVGAKGVAGQSEQWEREFAEVTMEGDHS